MNTIADYIRAAVAPYVPSELISSESLSCIQSVAGLLPGALSDFFGFECMLGIDEPIADFLVCARIRREGREVLAGRKPGCGLPQILLEDPIWRRVQNFAKEWVKPDLPLYRGVHNLWMEFDFDRPVTPIPTPNVFIGANHLQSQSGCLWLTHMALPVLLGAEMNEDHRAAVARCVNCLPARAHVFQVGLMLARRHQTCRLCIRGMSPLQLVDYLHALNWPGSESELTSLLASFTGSVERFDLDLDVSDRVLPKIGLELYTSAASPQLPALLASLISLGLCSERKAAAICSWPGTAHEELEADRWPEDLLAVYDQMNNRLHSVFDRAVHHIKLIHRPSPEGWNPADRMALSACGQRSGDDPTAPKSPRQTASEPLQAKVYLAVHHRFLTQEQFHKRFPSTASSPLL